MAWTEKYVTSTGAGAQDGLAESSAWDLDDAIANVSAGDRVNVKAGSGGSYSDTASKVWSVHGTSAAPIWWRGYKVTIGDMDARPTVQRVSGTDIPKWVVTGALIFINPLGDYNLFSNIHFESDNTGQYTLFADGDRQRYFRCRVISTNTANTVGTLRMGTGGSLGIVFEQCWISSASTQAGHNTIDNTQHYNFLLGCLIEGGGIGIDCNANETHVVGCVIRNTVGLAISSCFYPGIYFNTFENIGTDGVHINTGSTYVAGWNNYFHTIGGYAWNSTDNDSDTYVSSSCYHSLTSGQLNNFRENLQWDAQIDVSDQLVDVDNGDYTVQAASNALENAAPGMFEGMS